MLADHPPRALRPVGTNSDLPRARLQGEKPDRLEGSQTPNLASQAAERAPREFQKENRRGTLELESYTTLSKQGPGPDRGGQRKSDPQARHLNSRGKPETGLTCAAAEEGPRDRCVCPATDTHRCAPSPGSGVTAGPCKAAQIWGTRLSSEGPGMDPPWLPSCLSSPVSLSPDWKRCAGKTDGADRRDGTR